jgi:hypothetical protein
VDKDSQLQPPDPRYRPLRLQTATCDQPHKFPTRAGSHSTQTHLTAKNWLYVLQNPEPSSNTAMSNKLPTRVHFRPNRSARTPKINAPTERNSKVRVMAVVTCLVSTWNCSARSLTVRETQKYWHVR